MVRLTGKAEIEILAQRPKKLISREGDRVIKSFEQTYSVADVLNEALNQARVMETGLLIPQLLEVGKTPQGGWAITMKHIEGRTLASIMGENPDRPDELMERFVDIQLVMHSKAGRLLNSLKEKMIRQIDEAELDPVSRYDLHTRVESMPRRTNLCHGDYNPSNVIITPADTAFIIDWSHATQGDPAVDAARTYLLFHLNGQPQAAATYLDIFGHKSGIGRQEVERWLPAVAACQTLKGDKAQRDLLMRWVNVVDFE